MLMDNTDSINADEIQELYINSVPEERFVH